MFTIQDKNGKKLWIRDKIQHTFTVGPDTVIATGIVISFPEEGKLQYQRVNELGKDEESALPVICSGSEVIQVDSLAERALSLKNNVDFVKLLRDAEEQYLQAVADTKKKKAGTRGGKTPIVKQTEMVITLADNEEI